MKLMALTNLALKLIALTHQEIQQLKKIEGTHYMQPAYVQPSLKRWNEFIQSTKGSLKQAV